VNDATGGKGGKQAKVGNASASSASGLSFHAGIPEGQNEQNWSVLEPMFSDSRESFVRMAYRILQNKEDAEDAVQDALISSYVHLRGFEGRSALKTWFTRVVLNAALMIRRKRKPVQAVSLSEQAPEESRYGMEGIPSPEPDPETCCAKAEAQDVVRKLSARLTPPLRQAFSMCCANDMSVDKARLVTGVPTAACKARLFRARHQVIKDARRVLGLRPRKKACNRFSLSITS